MRRHVCGFLALSVLVGCGGGAGSWGPNDTRKATEILHAQDVELALCQADDGGACQPSHVRALSDLTRCKAASMLYEHLQPVGEDAGDCHQ